MQVIVGIPGLEPLEPVIEFVSNNHQHFTGGIFFINTQNEHLMKATEEAIKEVRFAKLACLHSYGMFAKHKIMFAKHLGYQGTSLVL